MCQFSARTVITELILGMICFAAAFVFVGVPMLIALGVGGIVFPVIGGLKAQKGELWPYPMSYPFFPVETDDMAASPEEVGSYDPDDAADQN